MGADGGGVCKRQIPATIPSHDFGRSGEEVHIDEARLNVGTASHVYADGILLSSFKSETLKPLTFEYAAAGCVVSGRIGSGTKRKARSIRRGVGRTETG